MPQRSSACSVAVATARFSLSVAKTMPRRRLPQIRASNPSATFSRTESRSYSSMS